MTILEDTIAAFGEVIYAIDQITMAEQFENQTSPIGISGINRIARGNEIEWVMRIDTQHTPVGRLVIRTLGDTITRLEKYNANGHRLVLEDYSSCPKPLKTE